MRILALLGETPSSCCARQLAYTYALSLGAELAGLAGIDLTAVDVRTLGGIGAATFQARVEEYRRTRAGEKVSRIHETYRQECHDKGVPFRWLSFEGDPLDALRLASEESDLLITGHDTVFSGEVQEGISTVVAKLLLLSPRPAIVCGDELCRSKSILVAYDGSIPAIRTLQLYVLLGLANERSVHVVAINPVQEICARHAHSAASYLRRHGVTAESIPVATTKEPAEVLRIERANREISMIVMGSYGHTGWRKLLFGSTTANLVERPPCPLFLFH